MQSVEGHDGGAEGIVGERPLSLLVLDCARPVGGRELEGPLMTYAAALVALLLAVGGCATRMIPCGRDGPQPATCRRSPQTAEI